MYFQLFYFWENAISIINTFQKFKLPTANDQILGTYYVLRTGYGLIFTYLGNISCTNVQEDTMILTKISELAMCHTVLDERKNSKCTVYMVSVSCDLKYMYFCNIIFWK
jgi:hypothetical protein